jgi:hypothetical protein
VNLHASRIAESGTVPDLTTFNQALTDITESNVNEEA